MAYQPIPAPGPAVHLSEFLKQDLRHPAVYFLYHKDKCVYVGQSKTLKLRLDTHLTEGRKVFDAAAMIRCDVRRLLEIESHYIREFAPKYNDCGIAKSAREVREWRRPLYAFTGEPIPTPAADCVLNYSEASDFLEVPQPRVIEWCKAGLIPDRSVPTLVQFACIFSDLVRQHRVE